MLKIKDNVELEEIIDKYDLYSETIDGDYEMGISGDVEYFKNSDGVFISERTKKVYGIDCSNLDLLYDLIKADMVERVDD